MVSVYHGVVCNTLGVWSRSPRYLGGSDPLVCEGPSAHGVERGAPPAAPGVLCGGHWEAKAPKRANARVDWLAMDDDDITKKFPILLEGILQDVYSQRAASAWQGAQPQKLTVSMLLPGTSSAAEWRDLLQSRRQFWPTLTTRHASLVPVSAEALQRERRLFCFLLLFDSAWWNRGIAEEVTMASNGKAVTGTAVMARSANEEKKKTAA